MNDSVANKAHEMAVKATENVAKVEQKVDSHEGLCSLRYKTINKTMERIEQGQKSIEQGQRSATTLGVTIGIAIIITLLGYAWTQQDSRMTTIESHHTGGE